MIGGGAVRLRVRYGERGSGHNPQRNTSVRGKNALRWCATALALYIQCLSFAKKLLMEFCCPPMLGSRRQMGSDAISHVRRSQCMRQSASEARAIVEPMREPDVFDENMVILPDSLQAHQAHLVSLAFLAPAQE